MSRKVLVPLVLPADPAAAMEAATKQYVDAKAGTPTITTPLVIPDPVGVSYPALRFASGDGQNGTLPNTYHYEFNLLNDELRLFSNRQPTQVLAVFGRPAVDEAVFKLHDYVFKRGTDGYLRLYTGSGGSNAAFDGSGNLWLGSLSLSGAITAVTSITASGWITTSSNITVNGGNVYGNGGLLLQSNGTSYTGILGYSNQAIVYAGHAYGTGDRPKVSVIAQPLSGTYWERALSVHTNGGSGAPGVGFANHSTGHTSNIQLWSDGTMYHANLNGDNTGYIKSYASAFTVISTRRFKAEVERLGSRARAVVDAIDPVFYRDLQHEMAFNADSTAPYPDGTPREPPVVEPRYRFGMIAEEVEEVAPELVDPSELGPGIDTSGLIAVLWKVVKELRADVAALQGGTT